MVRYDHKILNALLDSYENSLLSIGENKRTVHIDFVLTKKNLPQYFDESTLEYETIHILMKALEEKEFVEILWKNKKRDHQIERVRMNTDRVDEIYSVLGRVPKNELEQKNIVLLTEYLDQLSTDISKAAGHTPAHFCGEDIVPLSETVAHKFAEYLLSRLCSHQTVKEYIDLTKTDATRRLLQAVRFVEQNKEACYVREFSVRHFQDSKYFESVEHQVAGIFRKFQKGFSETDDDEILAEHGIYHTPNYVYFKGNAGIMLGDEMIHLDRFHQGIGLSGEDISAVRFAELSKIKKVLTIENLTTFFRWKEQDCLIIYLGGYHNSVRRRLLKEIYQALPDVQYWHFGDIDAGGFAILRDLQKKTGIPFVAYHMDLDTIMQYEKYGKKLSGSDRKRLEALAKESTQWRETIQYMLEHDVKHEHDCVRQTY